MCRYATIGAILMSKKVVDGIRDKGGFWKHGHTYQVRYSPKVPPNFSSRGSQAHPIACAASLAVQKVIKADGLLERCRVRGEYLHSLLEERLLGPNSITAPTTFDIRGGG
jgi:adenosylmethionine-8-amino-7-oxononanoate aminotransferase